MLDSSLNDAGQRAPRDRIMEQLRQQLGRWKAKTIKAGSVFSSGSSALDRVLPDGGWRQGMLVEWLGAQVASGAATLALVSAREACRQGGMLVVLDRQRTFYPPAAAAWGIDLDRLIVVRPTSRRDELWAAVESLRSPVVGAVWGAIDRLDSRDLRRLQLAAEAGSTLGVFLRPAKVRGQPTWADVQLWVEKANDHSPGAIIQRNRFIKSRQLATTSLLRKLAADSLHRVQIRVLRAHGSQASSTAVLEIDDATQRIREVKEERYRPSTIGDRPSMLADSR